MDVQVKVWLRDGHVWKFCCDEDDEILAGLVSALPDAAASISLPNNSVVQIEARTKERLFFPRGSLVAVSVVPNADELPLLLGGGALNSNQPEGKQKRKTEISYSFSAQKPLIEFAITTVPRPGDYVHQLIAALPGDLQLRLVVGTAESEYLKRYEENPFIHIVEAPSIEWERFRECGIHQRAAWNYWRALSIGRSRLFSKGLVVLEDDVIPASGWEHRLYRVMEQVETFQPGPYILALYAPEGAQLSEPENGRLFVSYPASSFFGSQAIYYPEAVRQGFSMYLHENALVTFSYPYDFLISDYAQQEKVPMFAAIPCLFQHIGEVSTGLGFFHRAHRFEAQ